MERMRIILRLVGHRRDEAGGIRIRPSSSISSTLMDNFNVTETVANEFHTTTTVASENSYDIGHNRSVRVGDEDEYNENMNFTRGSNEREESSVTSSSPAFSSFTCSSCSSIWSQNNGCTTQKALLITAACTILSIFVIVPFITSQLGSRKSTSTSNRPPKTNSPSIAPTLSAIPSLSFSPSISSQPSSSPSISHMPSLSSGPSTAPSDPVPSSSPTWNIVSTKMAFLINETYPMNNTAVLYYEDLLFDFIVEGFINYTVEGNVTLVEMIEQTESKDEPALTVGLYNCEAVVLTNFTNRDLNCLIRWVFNVTCEA